MPPSILAIDPGSEISGFVVWAHGRVVTSGIHVNHELLRIIHVSVADILALEEIGHYGTGMPAGKTVFDTCRWTGRMIECWCERKDRDESSIRLVLRPTIKTHICGTPRAKDANVATAVRDRLGPKGTRSNPGPTHGITSHSIQALALALYVSDQERMAA